MPVGLYMDHHVSRPITSGLRRRGVDVLTAAEDGADRLSDPDLLDRASALERVLFSQDRDLLTRSNTSTDRGSAFRRGDLRPSAPRDGRRLRARPGDDREDFGLGRDAQSGTLSAALTPHRRRSPSGTAPDEMLARGGRAALQLPDFALDAPTTEPSVGCRLGRWASRGVPPASAASCSRPCAPPCSVSCRSSSWSALAALSSFPSSSGGPIFYGRDTTTFYYPLTLLGRRRAAGRAACRSGRR